MKIGSSIFPEIFHYESRNCIMRGDQKQHSLLLPPKIRTFLARSFVFYAQIELSTFSDDDDTATFSDYDTTASTTPAECVDNNDDFGSVPMKMQC